MKDNRGGLPLKMVIPKDWNLIQSPFCRTGKNRGNQWDVGEKLTFLQDLRLTFTPLISFSQDKLWTHLFSIATLCELD
jgi:hypothetical protein